MIVLSSIVAVSLIAVAIMLIYALSPTQQIKKPTDPDQSKQVYPTKDALTAKQTVKMWRSTSRVKKAKRVRSRPVMAPGQSPFTPPFPTSPPLVGIAGQSVPISQTLQLESILKAMDYDKFKKGA